VCWPRGSTPSASNFASRRATGAWGPCGREIGRPRCGDVGLARQWAGAGKKGSGDGPTREWRDGGPNRRGAA
jgi:hypothetical protein